MQLKAKARRRREVCAEQVCVHTKCTGRAGRAAATVTGASLGKVLRGWGRCGATRSLLGFAPDSPNRAELVP